MNKGSLLMNNTSKRRKEKSVNRIKEKPKKSQKKKCHEVSVYRNWKNDQSFSTMEERREISKFDSLFGKIMAYFLKLWNCYISCYLV